MPRPLDLLAFGPHPDDLEIGLGGTIARHAAAGHQRRPVRSHRRRDGQQRHVPERLRGSGGRARACSARCGARTCGWPDRRFGKDPAHLEQAVGLHPPASPAGRGRAVLVRPPSGSRRREQRADRSGVQCRACGAIRAEGDAWKADWVCYYFINDTAPPSFVVDVTRHYETKRRALDCHASQFTPRPDPATLPTRLNTPLFRQMIESRDAQFGALAGVRWAEGFIVREPIRARRAAAMAGMNIGIVCYASIGGSGIIATELGKALALRGHRVHILSGDMPFRLGSYQPGLIVSPRRDAELSAVSRTAVPAVAGQQDRAGVARRAVSTSCTRTTRFRMRPRPISRARCWLARHGGGRAARDHDAARHRHHAARHRSVVFGNRRVRDRAVRRRHRRLGEPDGRHTSRAWRGLRHQGDSQFHRLRAISPRATRPPSAQRLAPSGRAAAHPRVELQAGQAGDGGRGGVRTRAARDAGAAADGRRRSRCRRRRRGWPASSASRTTSQFLGEQDAVVPLLSAADVFLLPSAQESFGLAALEAMACGVPVVASSVGGMPEVIEHGVTGFLHDRDDLDGMAQSVDRPADRTGRSGSVRRTRPAEVGAHALSATRDRAAYEAYYQEMLDRPARGIDRRDPNRARPEFARNSSLRYEPHRAQTGRRSREVYSGQPHPPRSLRHAP